MESRPGTRWLSWLATVVVSFTPCLGEAQVVERSVGLVTIQLGKPVLRVALQTQGGLAIPQQAERLFFTRDGSLQVREAGEEASRSLPVLEVIAAASGPGESTYVVDSTSQVHVFDAQLERRGRFRVAPRPQSIAVLSDGSVVVSAPARGKLLHLFTRDGRWVRSFGADLGHTADKGCQSRTFGTVLTGPSDSLYYVAHNATQPQVRVFTQDGNEIRQIPIEGEAVAVQNRESEGYRSAHPGERHGLTIINGAWLDASTADLWLALNGSSRTGLVYHYDARGRKMTEYRFLDENGQPLTAVNSIAIRGSRAFILVGTNLYEANLDTDRVRVGTAPVGHDPFLSTSAHAPDGTCPGEQPWNSCDATCYYHNNDTSQLNCQAELAGQLTPGYVVLDSSCSVDNGPPATCNAMVQICRNGTNTTHSAGLTCDAYCSHGCPPGYSEHCSGQEPPDQCGCCFDYSPIVVDLGRDGVPFSNAANGVLFDPNGLGVFRWIGWPESPDDALLARDVNGNGAIDSGAELFGNTTRLSSGAYAGQGYAALADLDTNSDGWVDGSDPAFEELLLWQDANRNGISEPEELAPLPARNITALATRYVESSYQDQWGNRFRYWSLVRASRRPYVRFSVDVFPVSLPVPPQ